MSLLGSWNGWAAPTPVPSAGAGWFKTILQLPPGDNGYLVQVDGVPQLDERNPLSTFRDEQEVSLLLVGDCSLPEVRVDKIEASDDGSLTLEASFLSASTGKAVDPSSARARLRDGTFLSVQSVDPASGKISLRGSNLPKGKHSLIVEASDTDGRAAGPARAAAWVKPAAATWQDGLLYQIVIDRFRGDAGAQLAAPATPGNRAGGTLDGIRAELDKGTFDALGVSVLWLTPVYLNPTEMREGSGSHMYEAYHGYWPIDDRKVDPHIGGDQALRDLVAAAHARGIRLLLDFVPNHVYETHPRYVEHKGTDWFHDKCVCGNAACPWSTHIETCWFTDYLPDFRFQNHEVMDLTVQDAIWWSDQFDTDGVRIDAVPMMPRATTRRIAHGLRTAWAPRTEKFVLGEVFTGSGRSGIASIRYFMGPDGLDSAFDFPLMWAMREAVAANKAGFDQVESALHETEVALEGSGAVLARIIGNHDTSRFMSEITGGGGGDPWTNPPVQPDDATPYQRQAMALALLLTVPGMPVIYYGDETGMAGAGDPDCRRVMPDLQTLSPARKLLLDQTRRLGRFRSCSKALRQGARVPLMTLGDRYVYRRDAGDGWPVVVVLYKGAVATDLELSGNALPPGVYLDVLADEPVPVGTQGYGQSVHVEPLTARVLVPAGNPCPL
ncbi:MAG: hypothetical protein HY898_33405 [Deltaproteobacteria bacterium]|nr:hypothetical protein [Deltaproteobacteria bacterium]